MKCCIFKTYQSDVPPLVTRHSSLVTRVRARNPRPVRRLASVCRCSFLKYVSVLLLRVFTPLREFGCLLLTCLFFLPLPLTTGFHRRNFDPSTPSRGGGRWPAKIVSTAGGAGGIPGRCSWIGAVAASKVFFGPSPGVKGVRRLAQSSRTNINNHQCPLSPTAGDPTFPLIGREKGPYARRSHRPAFH